MKKRIEVNKLLFLVSVFISSCSSYPVAVGPEMYGLTPMMDHTTLEAQEWREQQLYDLCVAIYEEYEDIQVVRLILNSYGICKTSMNVEYRLHRSGIPV